MLGNFNISISILYMCIYLLNVIMLNNHIKLESIKINRFSVYRWKWRYRGFGY